MNIAILLSTYNGSTYLKQQLNSLFNQSLSGKLTVFVRDDGSTDDTLNILRTYNVALMPDNDNLGSKESFATLLKYAITQSDADYFMFCDQDDVWFSNKVEKTLAKMKLIESEFADIPILVHTDLQVVDESLKTLAPSMWHFEHTLQDKNTFSRLLIQNTVTGCTVMINRALAEKCLTIPRGAIMHDWWIGLVASQFGKIGFIAEPTIKYRQHGKNTIGAKGFKINPLRIILGMIYSLVFRDQAYLKHMQVNIDQARDFLEIYNEELDEGSKRMLSDFLALPGKGWLKRRMVVIRWGLWKQGLLRNVSHLIRL